MYRQALLLALGVALSSMSNLFAQSRFLVSTYMYNGLVLNPAYAGSQQQFSLATLYRNQWLNIKNSPSFQMLSAHTPVIDNRIGVGLLASAEQIGIHQEYSAFAMFAYKLKLNFGYLAMGISGGGSVKSSNYLALRVQNQLDPYFRSNNINFAPNFGAGVFFYNARVYAGLSVPYLLNPARLDASEARKESVLRDIRSYYLTTGALLGSSSALQLNPSLLVRLRERTPLDLDLNLNLILQEVVLIGGSYRLESGFVLLSQLILNENFRVMYSYDFTTTDLSSSARASGTHEIMLNYRVVIRALSRDPHCSAYF